MKSRQAYGAAIENVRRICAFVVTAAEESGLDARAVYHCEVSVDEICTNIIEHGYTSRPATDPGEIEIQTYFDGECLEITITDSAPAFDPTTHEETLIGTDVMQKEPGGWGIAFVKKLMDSIQYEYSQGKNHLFLTKCVSALPAGSLETSGFAIWVTPPSGKIRTIKIQGRLDNTTAPGLSETLQEQQAIGYKRLVADLSQVTYISSSGLKVLASGWRSASESGREFVLAGATPHVNEILDMVGFTTFFEIYTDADHALTGQ